jgi:polygalacturonase
MNRFLVSAFAALTIAQAVRAADVSPALPVIPVRSFQLGDFGAVADGRTDNTDAFKRAVAAVNAAGGGTLVVPAGRYATGPVDLCSRLELRLEAGATLAFSGDPALYTTGPNRYRPLLLASNARDVALTGAGTIDGAGPAWWAEAIRFKREADAKGLRSNTSPRPNLVGFDRCQRVRVAGVTLTNSPKFNLVPSRCQDVTIEDVTIFNPVGQSPNTDGIDPSLCQRVLIARCRIDTNDDNIAIKSGGRPGEGVRDVLITDCTFLHGHGCSFGSETSGSVRNVTVRRCTFDGTDMGVRFKSDRTRGGVVEDVLYTDLVMKNVGQAIVLTSYYPERTIPKPGEKAEAAPVGETTPVWRNITVRNLTATAGTKAAGVIIGLPESPASGITLENVSIEAPAGLRIAYARDVTLRGVRVTAAKGEPLLLDPTVENLRRTEK